MKIALCLSGQPRGLEESFSSIKKSLLDANSNDVVDVYAHTWFDKSKIGEPFRKDTPSDVLKEDTEAIIRRLYSPKKIVLESPREFPHIEYEGAFACFHPVLSTEPSHKIQSMFYSIKQVHRYVLEGGISYDCVIRCRFDYWFTVSYVMSEFDMNKIWVKGDCKHTDYAINDHFAFSNMKNMEIYCTMFDHIREYHEQGIAFNPEVMLGFRLHELVGKENIMKTLGTDSDSHVFTFDERNVTRREMGL